MIIYVISMTIKLTAAILSFKQHLHHTEHKCGMQQQQHSCRPCMHFEMIKTWLVFWLLVVSLNYLTKFHDFSMIIQGFFKFHEISMHGTFFSDFPGFPLFPELVGTLFIRGFLISVRRYCFDLQHDKYPKEVLSFSLAT